MSSINQSLSSASSIARCYRVCCGEAPRRYNSGCGSGDAAPNSRLSIDMTDSADRNKAASPIMTGNLLAAQVIRSGARSISPTSLDCRFGMVCSPEQCRCRRERSCGTQTRVADAPSFSQINVGRGP